MKRIVETQGSGFDSLLGEKIELWCGGYFYVGTLVGVGDDHLELADDAMVVYETGSLSGRCSTYKDAQPLGKKWNVQRQAIESWGEGR